VYYLFFDLELIEAFDDNSSSSEKVVRDAREGKRRKRI
jgi:hypothetical protein